MPFTIEKLDSSNEKEAISFLSRYENSAIFLLGNLHEHGPKLSQHLNSGNFKLVRDGKKKVIALFCLTRRGNLLVQSELNEPLFEPIIASCKEETLSIRGLIGDWNFAKKFWDYLKAQKIIKKETFYGKEINYTLSLDGNSSHRAQEARYLEIEDYEQWKKLSLDYLEEQKLPQNISQEQMYQEFAESSRKLMIWGAFIGDELVSTAKLNAKTDRLGVVGRVYTTSRWRKQGFAKIVMNRLIFDCKNRLSLEKLIIFTGEDENKPAQKLYESLGSQKVGYIALFFAE